MIFLACIFMFLSIAVMLSFLMNRQIEETMAPSAMLMILILYISGVSGNLLVGEYTIIFLSVTALIYLLYAIIKKHGGNKIWLIITPGFLAFLVFMVINVILCKGRPLTEWDEFSHWGRVILNMYQWDQLGNCEGSTVVFPGYPPAVALWQYFFVCLKDRFSEPFLFAASNILAFVMMIPVYRKVEWKQWRKALFLFVTLLLLPLIFYSNFWSSIYVDGMLGIWLIYILYTHFSEKENTIYKILCISLAFGVYPLVKASGSGLAVLALLIIGADMLICCGQREKWKEKIRVLIIYGSSILIGKQSWSWYLKLSDTQPAWNASAVTLKKVVDMLKGSGQEWQYTTVKNFFVVFFEGKAGVNVFRWIVFAVLLIILLYTLKIWNKRQMFLYSGCFVICIMIYSLFLMILYCFTFSEYEAVRLASYTRYMKSILLGIIGFIICIWAEENSGMKGKTILAIILCLTVPFNSIKMYTVNMSSIKEASGATRYSYENIREFPDFMDWKNDKVWLIDQGTSGEFHIRGGYYATPVVFSPDGGWSLGEPLYEGDVWTVNYSAEEWENKLVAGEYTYMYINHPDEQFIERYGMLFENVDEIRDKTLWQICENDSGGVIFRLYRKY